MIWHPTPEEIEAIRKVLAKYTVEDWEDEPDPVRAIAAAVWAASTGPRMAEALRFIRDNANELDIHNEAAALLRSLDPGSERERG